MAVSIPTDYLVNRIKGAEGFSEVAYVDSVRKVVTIGYGYNLEAHMDTLAKNIRSTIETYQNSNRGSKAQDDVINKLKNDGLYWTEGHARTMLTQTINEARDTLVGYEPYTKLLQIAETANSLAERSAALARAEILVEMVFNMGRKKLDGFKKMKAALIAKKYGVAADEILKSDLPAQIKNRAYILAGVMRTGQAASGDANNMVFRPYMMCEWMHYAQANDIQEFSIDALRGFLAAFFGLSIDDPILDEWLDKFADDDCVYCNMCLETYGCPVGALDALFQ